MRIYYLKSLLLVLPRALEAALLKKGWTKLSLWQA